MDSVQILAQASTEQGFPSDWLVFPLQRQKVIIGILGWIFGALAGGLLFVFMAPIMIPHNYLNGAFSAIFSTIILGVVLYVCLGSIWAMITDIIRVREAGKHVIIITPEDFVKQEGNKVVHVPLQYVKYVTARGAPPVETKEEVEEDTRSANVGSSISSLFIGRRAASSLSKGGLGRRRVRTPTTLAFIDSRTDKEVVVVTDKAYGDPHEIAASLKEYAAGASVQ
ncbi:MAG TPA: hypothetical protein VF458_01515 [Ktedonobacteraceae bacterium]